jgi:gamma-glutamyltranspeptidase/glutathione hydrolase
MAPGTGIILAPAPNERGAGAAALGPVMLVNQNTGNFFFAAAASGGTTAPTAIAQVYLGAVVEERPLLDVVVAKRLHHNGDPDLVFHEPGDSAARLEALRQRGHALEEVPIIGRVNAVWCPDGTPRTPESCQAAADPRADGLAVLLTE